jgi:hypothetical protein
VFVSKEGVCVREQEVSETLGAVASKQLIASKQAIKGNHRQEGAETCNKRPKLEEKLDCGRSRSSSPKMSLAGAGAVDEMKMSLAGAGAVAPR